jgi:NADPH:quinone reductase-like Zn-dependent oxidoreductase
VIAARIHRHGGPDVLRVEEAPVPRLERGQLLVRMLATSINHRDVWIRRGHPHPAYRVALPAILGIDVCGDVMAVASDVEGFREGDRVTLGPYVACGRCESCRRGRARWCTGGRVFHGTYAQYAAVPARAAVPVAPTVPVEHVACLPNTYVTAWQALVGKARVGPADTVLVWAGTSGLGSAAIEVAQLAGATVIATAGTAAKRELVVRRGVTACLDHHAPDLVARVMALTDGRGVSIVFDHVGQATWSRSLAVCAMGGTVVTCGATTGDDARLDLTSTFARRLRIVGSKVGTVDDAMAAVRHLERGRFRPLIDREIGLDEIAEGHRLLERGAVAGKLVVRLD